MVKLFLSCLSDLNVRVRRRKEKLNEHVDKRKGRVFVVAPPAHLSHECDDVCGRYEKASCDGLNFDYATWACHCSRSRNVAVLAIER